MPRQALTKSEESSPGVAESAAPAVRWTQKKQLFVQKYLEIGDGAKAARASGYSQRQAANAAWRLLNTDPLVQAAVEKGRLAVQERHEITVDSMIEQLDEDRAFAVKVENATAAVRASELKAKMAGLLVDRVDQRSVAAVKVEIVSFDAAPSPA